MKTIVVDDEKIMIESFLRQSKDLDGLSIIETFQYPEEAESFAKENEVDLAVLDIRLPGMTGLELAKRLRKIRPDMLIVFISAYDEYIKESNEMNADYYILKPYTRQTIEQMVSRMKLLSQRQKKSIYIQMFGRFTVFHNNIPTPLVGKTKEILAVVATRRGKEISNEEIYSIVWEGRPYGNVEMKVYYNAIKRLKNILEKNNIANLLISTERGQILNTAVAECDYYSWLEKHSEDDAKFEGDFLTEYSWGEYFLANIMNPSPKNQKG